MSAVEHQRIKDIFLAACGLAAEPLAFYLQAACGDDVELRGAVERLLAADRASAQDLTAAVDPLDGDEIPGYRVIALRGEGGMGLVCEALQETPVRRRVALELIKLSMDTRQLVARFESERQALAIMNHPHIAKS